MLEVDQLRRLSKKAISTYTSRESRDWESVIDSLDILEWKMEHYGVITRKNWLPSQGSYLTFFKELEKSLWRAEA